MQENPTRIDDKFKKLLVATSVGMFVFLLIAFVLFFFKGPDVREGIIDTVNNQSTITYFAEESLKADLGASAQSYASTILSVITSMRNELIEHSSEYGRKIDDKELTAPSKSIKEKIVNEQKNNNLDSFFSEESNKLLGQLQKDLSDLAELSGDKFFEEKAKEVELLLEP